MRGKARWARMRRCSDVVPLDDQIQLISSCQLELDADAAGRSKRRSWRTRGPCLLIESGAGGRCGRSSPQPRQQRRAALLEWLAFFLKFSKGCFIERTATRLSDVLGKILHRTGSVSPGYLFYAIHQLRETLARGNEGVIPLFRTLYKSNSVPDGPPCTKTWVVCTGRPM